MYYASSNIYIGLTNSTSKPLLVHNIETETPEDPHYNCKINNLSNKARGSFFKILTSCQFVNSSADINDLLS